MAQRMTQTVETLTYLSRTQRLPAASVIAVEVAVILAKWAQRRRTRLALHQLTPTQLKDIGVTPSEARIEANKPFWTL